MAEPAPGSLDLVALEREVAEGRIDTVIAAVPDLYGRLVGKRITGRFFLEETASKGMQLCNYLLACDMEMDPTPGYAFTSWEKGYGDMCAIPDFASLRKAAWLDRTAIVLCDAVSEDGEGLVEVAPRTVLRRQVERAAGCGFAAKMGSELEFFLFDEDLAAAHAKGYRDLHTRQKYIEDYHVLSGSFAEPILGEIRRRLEASAIPVEFSKGEWGPGQHEINLRYAPALEMADRHVIYKLAAKEIAAAAGCALTFMAKWDENLAGSSMHIHTSLWSEADAPLFPGEISAAGRKLSASETFLQVLAGLLDHARELAVFFAPNVNSYKRFRAGTFAPTGIAWSCDNRTAGFRIVGRGPSLRIESRLPGADANPYLAFAAMLAAGLDGIERRLDPGPAFEGDVYAASHLPQVPGSLEEAIAELSRSDFARRALGDEVVDHYLHFVRSERAACDARVSDVERGRYFERI